MQGHEPGCEMAKLGQEQPCDECRALREARAKPPTDFDCEKCSQTVFVHVPDGYDVEASCPNCGNVDTYYGY